MLSFDIKQTLIQACKGIISNLEPTVIHECLSSIKEIVIYSDEDIKAYICNDKHIVRMLIRYLKSQIESEYSPCLDVISHITSSDTHYNID